ncbi:TetR/AcrR family transcriptional regulator [Labilithrix luteola]|uniref:TetR/AcrR family transcriptional regulator n=1 Tax=Labilithrix luteola TaxID=1391654 RepID=UPI0014738649|nr:TetR/AcrR family transcriptional regulator [Labilithrix luteola]
MQRLATPRKTARKTTGAATSSPPSAPSAPSGTSPSAERGLGKQIRGERLVDNVLEATLEELARVGYGAFSMETVAERAGVHKTSVYRRWPTKADLTGAALQREADSTLCFPDTGSIRSDVVSMMREFRNILATHRGQSLVRMMLAEGPSPELAALVDSLRKKKEKEPKQALARAVAQGELPAGTDIELVLCTLIGALQNLYFVHHELPTDRRIEQMVNLVFDGACSGGGCRVRAAK